MRQFRPSFCKVSGAAHPVVKRLFTEMEKHQIGGADMADRAGVCRETLTAWKNRNSPSVANLEACLNVVGLTLTVKALPDRPGDQ